MKKAILFIGILSSLGIGVNQALYAQNTKAATSLSKEEEKIIAYIDANMPRAIALLKESVDINSGTLNIEGVKKVGAIFAREFEKANFKTKWISLPDSLRRGGHLVASIGFNKEAKKTTKGKKLFLI